MIATSKGSSGTTVASGAAAVVTSNPALPNRLQSSSASSGGATATSTRPAFEVMGTANTAGDTAVIVSSNEKAALAVLIVEDHALIGQGLMFALRADGVRAEAICPLRPEEVLETADRIRPDVVLLDLNLGDGVGSGLPFIAPLRQRGATVVILTGSTDRLDLAACLEAGATGLASKSESFDEVLAKVFAAAEGRPSPPEGERQQLLAELRAHRAAERDRLGPFERLTPRERAVLAALLEGASASMIADMSFVSLATVRSQIRAILEKLGVGSQLAAVAMARQAGWVHQSC